MTNRGSALLALLFIGGITDAEAQQPVNVAAISGVTASTAMALRASEATLDGLADSIGGITETPADYTSHWWFSEIVNAVGNIINTGYAEGLPFQTGEIGVNHLVRRCNTLGPGSADTNQDRMVPCGTQYGEQVVVIGDGTGGLAALTEDAEFDDAVRTFGPQSFVAAVAHGSAPTEVSAAGDAPRWIANRAGVPFVMAGHPNVFSTEAQIQDADGAQTNAAIVTVSAGTKIVITFASVSCDGSTTGPTDMVIGFGTATIPARAHTGTTQIILAMDGVPPGGGKVEGNGSGILAIGADNEDVRITTEDPVGGNCSAQVRGYTVAS